MKKIKTLCYILFFGIIISFTNSVKAYDPADAMNLINLSNINVNASEFQNNQYTQDIAQYITDNNYTPVPDECYATHIIFTNDTNKILRFNKIELLGSIIPRSGYTPADYPFLLENNLYYSFNINSGQESVPDTRIANFPGTTMTESSTQLNWSGGAATLNDYIYLNPGSTVDFYYDYSMAWDADGRALGMIMNHSFTINFEDVTKYSINTEVENGTIDASVSNLSTGANQTINYQPKDGYELSSVIVDGNTVDINTYPSSYTFSNITANHTIKVIYTLIPDNPTPPKPEPKPKSDPGLPKTGNEYLYITAITLIIAGGLAYTSYRFKNN